MQNQNNKDQKGYDTFCNHSPRNNKSAFKSNLLRHVKLVHVVSEKVSCIKCNKSMKPISLKVHMKDMHSDPTKYSCNVCTFQTIYHSRLKKHEERVHIRWH